MQHTGSMKAHISHHAHLYKKGKKLIWDYKCLKRNKLCTEVSLE